MNSVKKLVLPLLFAIAIVFGAQVVYAQDDSNAAKIEARRLSMTSGYLRRVMEM